jgi:hypothetical protein
VSRSRAPLDLEPALSRLVLQSRAGSSGAPPPLGPRTTGARREILADSVPFTDLQWQETGGLQETSHTESRSTGPINCTDTSANAGQNNSQAYPCDSYQRLIDQLFRDGDGDNNPIPERPSTPLDASSTTDFLLTTPVSQSVSCTPSPCLPSLLATPERLGATASPGESSTPRTPETWNSQDCHDGSGMYYELQRLSERVQISAENESAMALRLQDTFRRFRDNDTREMDLTGSTDTQPESG